MSNKLILRQPDDWHVHVRQGEAAKEYVRMTAAQFGRATIMPNTKPPIKTVLQASKYRKHLMSALPKDTKFFPMMTLYLTDETHPVEIKLAAESPIMIGAKLYPAGATTNSSDGLTNLYTENAHAIFRAMELFGLPLLVHAELAKGDVFGREKRFLKNHMDGILEKYPKLKVVIEHITTAFACMWVEEKHNKGFDVAATITAHHLLVDYNDMLGDGLRPHLYCKPILKSEEDRETLIRHATDAAPYIFAGTDSAPHPIHAKHTDCCAAGCFTAPHAIELYAEAFDRAGRMDQLEKFMSVNGAQFFGLPLNYGEITLVEEPHKIPDESILIRDESGAFRIKPFMAGEKLHWKLKDGDGA